MLLITLAMAGAFSSCALFKGAGSSKGVLLRHNLEEGQPFTVKTQSSNEITSEQMGQEISITAETSSTMNFTVKGQTADGNHELVLSYTELTQKAESPMGGGETDYGPILGKELSLELSPRGETDKFKGFDQLPPITNAMGEKIEGQVHQMGIEQMFTLLPEEPVKKGYTWTEEINSEMPYGGGNLKTTGQTVYTVVDFTEANGLPCAQITAVSSSTTKGEISQQGMSMTLERTGKSESVILFAYTKGMFLSMESTGKTDGIVDIPAAGMTIPQAILTKASFTVSFD